MCGFCRYVSDKLALKPTFSQTMLVVLLFCGRFPRVLQRNERGSGAGDPHGCEKIFSIVVSLDARLIVSGTDSGWLAAWDAVAQAIMI
jgi:hypothetical protein